MRVAWHDACHLARGASGPSRARLRAIGLEVREIAESRSAAAPPASTTWSTEPAAELGDRKAANVLATGADLLVTSNPGCLLQLRNALERRGHHLPMAHVAEVLDTAVRGAQQGLLNR